jgi:hypothetical protein
MATTTGGTPYVQSSDLVSGWPTSSLAVGNHVDLIAGGDMHASTTNHTVTLAQILGNKVIVQNSASATVVTLPSVGLVNGMQVKVVNINTGAVTFTGGTVTGTVVSITTQYTGLTLLYYATVWYAVPFSSGSATATVSATTGSPTITTVGSKTVYQFTGSGSITLAAGIADVYVISGGGSGALGASGVGGGGGGGAGGQLYATSVTFTAATHTVTIGGGGAASSNKGNPSGVFNYATVGGGPGTQQANAGPGASGGGSTGNTGTGGLSTTLTGFKGGASASGGGGGGGGGAGAVGVDGVTNVSQAGGAGVANSITGASVTRGGGGGAGYNAGATVNQGGAGGGGDGGTSGVGSAGSANTGSGGGGGANAGSAAGGNGGSGTIFILIG